MYRDPFGEIEGPECGGHGCRGEHEELCWNAVESVLDTVDSVLDTVESVLDTVESVLDTIECVLHTVESASQYTPDSTLQMPRRRWTRLPRRTRRAATNPNVKTKSMVFRSLIYLDRDPFLGVCVKANQRSENHRFGLDVRVGGALDTVESASRHTPDTTVPRRL